MSSLPILEKYKSQKWYLVLILRGAYIQGAYVWIELFVSEHGGYIRGLHSRFYGINWPKVCHFPCSSFNFLEYSLLAIQIYRCIKTIPSIGNSFILSLYRPVIYVTYVDFCYPAENKVWYILGRYWIKIPEMPWQGTFIIRAELIVNNCI